MSATMRLTVMIGVTTMALLSWAALVSAGGGNCPADAIPKPPCPEAANLMNACFVQEKFCDAAASQLLADANQFFEASKKCSQQGQSCYGDAAKLCGCPSAASSGGSTGTVVPMPTPAAGTGTIPPTTAGGGGVGTIVPTITGVATMPTAKPNTPWAVDVSAGQRGAQRGVAGGVASGFKCADGTPIPTDPVQLKMWLDSADGGADTNANDNDLDYDGIPDFKVKAKIYDDGTAVSYVMDRTVQCDTCVKGDNICSGPEGADKTKNPCYNPSQSKEFCK